MGPRDRNDKAIVGRRPNTDPRHPIVKPVRLVHGLAFVLVLGLFWTADAGAQPVEYRTTIGGAGDELRQAVSGSATLVALQDEPAPPLAQSMGQLTGLTGRSAGLLDQRRQTTGLDRLEVGVGGDTGEASVSGGRYLGEGVYVGVEQGLDEQSSRVDVEIELTPNIKVESDVGADAEGRIGVNPEWNY